MAIIKSAVKLIVREHIANPFQGPVLTLGVPEIYASFAELADAFRKVGMTPGLARKEQVTLTTNETGRSFEWVSAASFFQLLGLSPVHSIDVPGCEHAPDLIHDLNTPLPASHVGRFNLVIDPGTTEHVCDVKTCLTNVVRALRVGGVVIQFLPIYSFNGGYLSINPNLLNDFFAANGFEQIRSYVIMWDRYRPYTGKSRCYPYSVELLGARHALADHDQCRFTPHVLLFARKGRDVTDIRVPIQNEAAPPPGHEEPLDRVARLFGRSMQKLLPRELGYAVNASVTRELALRRSRRRSFWI